MALTPEQLIQRVETYARSAYVGHDPAHDLLHIQRVLSTAVQITHAEQASGTEIDLTIVKLACWLHDVVQLPKGTGPPGEAARQSATIARDLLRSLNTSHNLTNAVSDAIASHSYSGGYIPETIEAGILQDADRIDALGAIGIARLWIIASQRGNMLYSALDPAATNRSLDDQTFALDHIKTKLLNLPATMNTQTGRKISEARLATTKAYYKAFLDELDESL